MLKHLIALILCALPLTACRRDKIAVYKAPKEMPPASMPMAAPGMQMPEGHPPVDAPGSAAEPHGHRDLEWTVPKGWTEKPPSQMRVGSFAATGKNGQPVDISIVTLAGEAGGDLSNINRWRGQIELPPISEETLAKETKKISPAGRPMLLADMVSDKPLIDGKMKKRLVAVICVRAGQSWFFKMLGEDSAVTENMPALMKLLESLKFAHE